MKKLKILAVMFAIVFSVAGAYASKSSKALFNATGYRSVTCFTPESVDQANCSTSNHGAQCTIALSSFAWDLGCSAALNQP